MSAQEIRRSFSFRQRALLIGVAIAGLLALSILIILWPRGSCEGIFRQTAPKLEAQLEIIKQKGTLAVSQEQIQVLSEGAQKVGLHLKTCCSVLDGGKLDPQQFQQCIDKASVYDRQIALIAQEVTEVTEAKGKGAAPSQEQLNSIDKAIKSAANNAESFARHVAQIKPRPQPPEPTPPSMRVSSQLLGVTAELVAFSRFENTLTLKLRFVNEGKDSQEFSPSSDMFGSESSYLLDEATGKRYKGSDRTGRYVSVPAGNSVDFWIKYILPEGERPRHLTAVLNHGILLEHVEVP